MNTPTPRTNEWETYCDECYYHMWRVRRKNERGFDDGFHVQNGEGARQLVELLNKQDEELTTARSEIEGLHYALKQSSTIYDAVTEQRDGLRSGIDYASDQLTTVTEQRDKLIKAIEPLEYWRDISECDCSCPLAQGGCLRCDLNRILKITNPNEL